MVAFYPMDGKENQEQSSMPQKDNTIIICQVLHSQWFSPPMFKKYIKYITLNTLKALVHYSINAIVEL